jgi:hypothetical protein
MPRFGIVSNSSSYSILASPQPSRRPRLIAIHVPPKPNKKTMKRPETRAATEM